MLPKDIWTTLALVKVHEALRASTKENSLEHENTLPPNPASSVGALKFTSMLAPLLVN